MIEYFAEVWKATAGILKGLRVTLVTMLKPAITVQYPDEKLVPYDGFRGALLYDAELCRACGLCAKACPSDCIAMDKVKNEQGKPLPKASWYSIDFGKCHFCGLCVEACPTKPRALWHSLDYELTFSGRRDMVRYWKKGFDYAGKTHDPDTKGFKDPEQQVPLRTVREHP